MKKIFVILLKKNEVKKYDTSIKDINIKIPCKIEGEYTQFILDYDFLLDAIKNVKNNEVIFNLTGKYGPVFINDEDLIIPFNLDKVLKQK